MSTWIKVARYQMVQPMTYTVAPSAVLAFTFAVNAVVFALIPVSGHGGRYSGGLMSLFIFLMVLGMQSIGRAMPFGLALGASRRSFYSGTALTGISTAFAFSLGVTVLQAIERATSGWGVSMYFFRVPYILNGAWYATLLTSFAGMSVLFVYGMWYGIVYRRWGLTGTLAFSAAQVLAALAGALAVTWWYSWSGVAGHLASLTALDLTGLLAALTVLLLAGGHATIRRAAV